MSSAVVVMWSIGTMALGAVRYVGHQIWSEPYKWNDQAFRGFANDFSFRLRFPRELEESLLPSQSLRRLLIHDVKIEPTTQVGEFRVGNPNDIRYYALSPIDEDKFPHFPQLMNLHMSIQVYSEEQVIEDFKVMLGFAKKHALKRLSITHEERLEHHHRYSPELAHKAEHRGNIYRTVLDITNELGVLPLSTSMTSFETNGHNIPGEPGIYVPKHNWGGSQYTWSWIAEEGATLEWETED